MKISTVSIRRLCYWVIVMAGMLLPQAPAYAVLTITPNSWNIIGMDSNSPVTGPRNYPVMAEVCSDTNTTNVATTLVWDSTNSYINVRTGTNSSYTIPAIAANTCEQAYFEVEVNTLGCGSPTCASFDTTRKYHITATDGSGSVSTTTPREFYVEHLVSQSRNSITAIKYWAHSLGANPAESVKTNVPAGGTMTVAVGSQYYIELTGATATNGYNQYTQYINLPNNFFRIDSLNSTYNVLSNTDVVNPHTSLYADACHWDNNPNSPTYRSCAVSSWSSAITYPLGQIILYSGATTELYYSLQAGNINKQPDTNPTWWQLSSACNSSNDYCSNGKAGGSPNKTLYEITITGGAGTNLTINTLLYDFSGSSFHYNADFSTGFRYVQIESAATIDKSFSPATIAPGGTSTLTFTLNNPGADALSGVNFSDTFPSGLTVAPTPGVVNNCGGTFTATALSGSVSLSGGGISANSNCTISVDVTAAAAGTYPNVSDNLFINTGIDTGDNASATLIVTSAPTPPSTCAAGTRKILATWDFTGTTANTTADQNPGDTGPFTGTTTQIDVTLLTAIYNSQTGSAVGIANTGTFPTGWDTPSSTGAVGNFWGIRGAWLSANPTAGSEATAVTPSFQFQVDASKYGAIGISASYNLRGNWSNSGNWYVINSTNGATWSYQTGHTGVWDKSNGWKTGVNGLSATMPTTGNANQYFRIYFAGAQYSGNPSATTGTVYLDTVDITGCPLPTPPTLAKSFTSSTIAKGAATGLTFTVTNPNTDTTGSYNYTGIRFTDALPGGLTLNSATPSSNTCGFTVALDTANGIISLSGGSLAANASGTASCSITFPATTVTGTVAGTHINTTSQVLTNQTDPGNSASANLTVLEPPVLSKNFAPAYTTGATTLTFSVNNPNASTQLSGIAFSDTLPSGLSVSNSTLSACGGTNNVTVTAATRTIAMTGGTLTGGSNCTFSVPVSGSTAGTYNNTTGNVTASGPVSLTGNTASATLQIVAPSPKIDLTKQVSTTSSGPWYNYITTTAGSTVYYRFKVYNSGDVSLSGVNINETQSAVSPTCSGSSLAADAELYCTASVTAAAGTTTNIATARGTYISTDDTESDPSSATYSTTGLWLTKAADPATFAANGNVITYSYVVTNNGSAALAGPVTIADNKTTNESCPALSTVGNGDNNLDPGESITCSSTYTIVSTDTQAGSVTNIATASAGSVTSNTATKTVYYAPPTYVLVSNFHAGTQNGQTVLEWSTEREQGTLGFFIERQNALSGEWQRLNNGQMLPGLIAAPRGGDYRFADPDAVAGKSYNYRLIEREMWGAEREYGPWNVTISENSGVRTLAAADGDEQDTTAWRPLGQGYSARARHIPVPKRADAPVAQDESAAQAPSQVSRLRFRTGADGLYRIGPAKLADAAAMLGITAADLIKNLKGGHMQLKNANAVTPYYYNPDDKSLYFVGNAYQTRETDENVYRLAAGAGSVMPQASGAPPLPAVPGVFRDVQRFEENKPDMLLPWIHQDENADYWYWDYVYPPYTPSATLAFRLPDPASVGQGVLKVFLRGATNESTGADREATAVLNGTPLQGSVKWSGNKPAVLQTTFSQAALTANADGSVSMRLKINGALGKGAGFDLFLIDRVEVEYYRKMRAHQGGIWMHSLAKGIKAADGFASRQINVVENPGTAQAKWRKDITVSPAADGSWQVSFKAGGGIDYLAVETPKNSQPEADSASKLKSPQHNAGYLIIAPRELANGAAALANYRNQEFGAEIVWLQDIYDEFSFGRTSSKAIEAFLDYAHAKWKRVPSYVVLLGRGTLDHRDLLGYHESLIPMRLTATPWGLSGSDNRYADVDGDHLPDYSLGRIAVSSNARAIAYVDKLAGYETAPPGAWSSRAALVADNPDKSGNFRSDSDHVGGLLRNYTLSKLYHPLVGVRSKLLAGWNNGYGYVNYVGHGASTQLAAEGFLTVNDVTPATLQNGNKLPIFAALSCVVGDSTMPGILGLSDKLVLLPGGGAIAAFSALGLSLNSQVAPLNVNFVESLLVNRESVGSAAVTAHGKAAAQSEINLFMHDIYQVSGDPAVTLH